MAYHSKSHFKVSSRLPLLLGDELIPDAGYAVFELVKNSHDADATFVDVTLNDSDDINDGIIIVKDDGDGMDEDIILNSWLVLGSSLRRQQVKNKQRTKKFKRPYLGEKGIGRFASHKLGTKIRLITRMVNKPEYIVDVNWRDFDPDSPQLIEAIPVTVSSRKPEVFKNDESGTLIEISVLRDSWSRGMARKLHREITSISSPFKKQSDFSALMRVSPQEEWLDDLFTFDMAETSSPFSAKCVINGKNFSYDYSFAAPSMFKKSIEDRNVHVELEMPTVSSIKAKDPDDARLHIDEIKILEKIGSIELNLLMFELEHAFVRAIVEDRAGLKKFLKENGGIRVYRGGFRVFGLGGAGEDWLNLGGRRVQRPAARLSNNQIIGAVTLPEESVAFLIEQTNRRGFTESAEFRVLRKALLAVIVQLEAERHKDKSRIKSLLEGKKVKIPVIDELRNLREAAQALGPEEFKKLSPAVDRVEKAYTEIRDTLITAASSGLSLGSVVHDVEKQVKDLHKIVVKDPIPVQQVRDIVSHIDHMMDGFTYLLKKSPKSKESLKELVKRSIFNLEHRFDSHKIHIINGFTDENDIKVKCSRRLIVGAIMNIIDNAIWWLSIRGHKDKIIYIGPSQDISDGPSLIIADNGPGFMDPPEDLVNPYFSRKQEGMGMGLFLVDQAMILQEGRLDFPGSGDVWVPDGLNGAVLALVFSEKE